MSAENDPAWMRWLLDRRRFLGLSALGAGAVLGLTPGAAQGAVRTGPQLLETAGVQGPVRAEGASSSVPLHPPYSLDADCVLSEDYFLVDLVAVTPGTDKVISYSWPGSQAEAILLQKQAGGASGAVVQVYRDPAAAGGWNSRALAEGATDVVAGVALDADENAALHVFYRAVSGVVHYLRSSSPATAPALVDTFSWGTGPLQVATDAAAGLLAYCVTPSSAAGRTDAKLSFYWTYAAANGQSGPADGRTEGTLTGFAAPGPPAGRTSACAATVNWATTAFLWKPTVVLYTPSSRPGSVTVDTFTLPVGGGTGVTGQLAAFGHQPPSPPPGGAKVASFDYATNTSEFYLPTAVALGHDNGLYALSLNFLYSQWHWTPLQTGSATPPQWEPGTSYQKGFFSDGTLLNLFVVNGTTLSVIRQYQQPEWSENATTPVFNQAIPLQGGVASVASQMTPSDAGDQLFVITAGQNNNLQLLATTQPAGTPGTWYASGIHLPATAAGQISTYRAQLSLADSWGVPAAGQTLTITASLPATALVNGQSVFVSATPATVTTDTNGQVTVAIIADGLYAPALTVTSSLLSAVTVSPSGPVNTYMDGSATLNYLPAMSAATLTAATSSSGAPLFPGASDAGQAASAAAILKAASQAGANPSAPPQAGQLQLTLGAATRVSPPTVQVNGVTLSFDDLIDDAWNAIKTGAAKVTQVAHAVGSLVFEITADFEAWGTQLLKLTIEGLEDAAHVFHSVINQLKAVAGEVIDWLKTEILSLLQGTVTLAGRYDTWLVNASQLSFTGQLTRLIGLAEDKTDQFFTDAAQAVHDKISELKKAVGGKPLNALGPPGPAAGLSRAAPAPQAAGQAPSDARSRWLLEKLKQSAITLSAEPVLSDEFAARITKVVDDLATSGVAFATDFGNFLTSIGGLVANPKDFGTVLAQDLLSLLDSLIDTAFTLAKDLAVDLLKLLELAVTAFSDLLQISLDDIPLIGPLLKAAGLPASVTIGGLVTLMVAFPTALAYKLDKHDANALPFQDTPGTAALSALDPASIAEDLNFTTAAATAFWAWTDFLSTLEVALAFPDGEPPALWTWIDIAAPAVISCLTVPAHDGDLPFTSPIDLNDDSDVIAAIYWAFGALPGVFSAIGYYYEKNSDRDQQIKAMWDSMYAVTSMGGVITVGTGIWSAYNSPPGNVSALAAVAALTNLGAVLTAGLVSKLVDSTEGLSAVITGVVGLVCGVIGAILQDEDT